MQTDTSLTDIEDNIHRLTSQIRSRIEYLIPSYNNVKHISLTKESNLTLGLYGDLERWIINCCFFVPPCVSTVEGWHVANNAVADLSTLSLSLVHFVRLHAPDHSWLSSAQPVYSLSVPRSCVVKFIGNGMMTLNIACHIAHADEPLLAHQLIIACSSHFHLRISDAH